MVVPQGDNTQGFLPEVDNAAGIAMIYNMMIGPCYDSKGIMRGLIQLINKVGEELITENDRKEFVNLCPTVGEIIAQCDEVQTV